MTNDMTTQQALEAIKEADSKDVLEALRNKIEDIRRSKIALAAGIQGEVTALSNVIRLIDALGKTSVPSDEEIPAAVAGESKLDQERKERTLNKKCVHRDRKTKKWCERTLDSKIELAEGYCAIHLIELGICRKTASGKLTYVARDEGK